MLGFSCLFGTFLHHSITWLLLINWLTCNTCNEALIILSNHLLLIWPIFLDGLINQHSILFGNIFLWSCIVMTASDSTIAPTLYKIYSLITNLAVSDFAILILCGCDLLYCKVMFWVKTFWYSSGFNLYRLLVLSAWTITSPEFWIFLQSCLGWFWNLLLTSFYFAFSSKSPSNGFISAWAGGTSSGLNPYTS